MRAAEYDRYGAVDVLEVRDVPLPALSPQGVRVAVDAAALNPKDILFRRGKFALLAGRRFPKRVGYDWAGRVLEVGSEVSDLQAGEAVYGMIDANAGGACSEQIVAQRSELSRAPSGWSPQQSAAVPLAALTAVQALRDLGHITKGCRVLLNGASGGVGVFAIQVARALGAEVITTSGPGNLALCESLGAHRAIDYNEWHHVDRLRDIDCWFDIFGNKGFRAVRRSLSPRATFVSTVPKRHILLWHALTLVSRPRCRLVLVKSRAADLKWLAALAEEGGLKPVIDSVYPLSKIAAAQARVETRHARGKVVVQIG
jgi:NADPH:quinone reductase-like Zn-dependent oxidoreductase